MANMPVQRNGGVPWWVWPLLELLLVALFVVWSFWAVL